MGEIVNGEEINQSIDVTEDVTAGDDIFVGDDLVMAAGGLITTATNQNLNLVPNGSGVTMNGAGSPGHLGTPASGDLYIQGRLEVDGQSYFDGQITCYGEILMPAGSDINFGAGDAALRYDANQTNNAMILGISTASEAFIVCQAADVTYNWAHATQTHPTIFVQSKEMNAVEYATLAYNDLSISGGAGAFCGLKSVTEEVTIPV